jgi:hypothetical protein
MELADLWRFPSSATARALTMAMVTVATTPHGSMLPFATRGPARMKDRPAPLILVPLGTLVLIAVSVLLWRREQRFRWAPLFAVAMLVCLGMTLTSCGGVREEVGEYRDTSGNLQHHRVRPFHLWCYNGDARHEIDPGRTVSDADR